MHACLITTVLAAAVAIPPHPDQIKFPELRFEPPRAADYRHELPGGVTVYLAPSHELPLIDVAFTFRGGDYLDPPGKVGLARATASMMRRGGTTTISPEPFDEELDYLAANASANAGLIRSTASLNCLASNLEEAFTLFMDMVRHPGFDQDRLDLYRKEVIENLKQRNDDAQDIVQREWSSLIYGRDHFEAAEPTAAGINSITRDDLEHMHGLIFHPGNLVVAVSGDFDEAAMLARLKTAFEGWAAGPIAPPPPEPQAEVQPGVYHVEKDIPQGRVAIGKRSIARDDPDWFAVQVMNRILGGGGFTSRIVSRVRSDEGLAYSAGSRVSTPVDYPGDFTASFQSKSPTVPLAAKIIIEEIDRIRAEPVGADELELAKSSIIETFPRRFESKSGMLSVFVDDQLTDRPADFWQRYRDRVRAVSASDVQKAAKAHLDPSQMAILIVGTWDDIVEGDLENRADMSDFHGGSVNHLPLRDPLTLEPLD